MTEKKHKYESLRIVRLPHGGYVVSSDDRYKMGESNSWLAAFSHDELNLALRYISGCIDPPSEEELD